MGLIARSASIGWGHEGMRWLVFRSFLVVGRSGKPWNPGRGTAAVKQIHAAK
jgi:hypothetical protein